MIRQHGFGAIAAIVVLVILAVLSAAIVSFSSVQQIGSAQDVMSAKAWQAARAGDEWGLYQALKGQDWAGAGTTCDTASRTHTLDLITDAGFHVTVSCDSWSYNEGQELNATPPPTFNEKLVRVYRITAVACPAATCPAKGADLATVAGVGYVERTRVVLVTDR